MSTELATQDSAVPDLVRPARGGGLDSRHVTLPRLYKGETQSNAFKAGLIKAGCIYIGQGADDPDPIVVAEKPFTDEKDGDTIRVHILQVKLGLSRKQQGRPLETWEYNDPTAPLDARETFDFTLALPEIDPDIPVKVLMSSTSTQTAKRINFPLLRLGDESRWPELAFDFSIKKRTKTEGGQTNTWFVWQSRQVGAADVKDEHVEIAKALAEMLGGAGDVTPPAPAPQAAPAPAPEI
jgi:hypothetical protein